MRLTRRSALAALELMLATVLLALVLVPFLTTTVDTGREAGFSEATLLATARAEALVDAARVPRWPGAPGDELALPLPPEVGPPPVLPGANAADYSEALTARALEDGLVLEVATVRWSAPLPHAGDPHRVTRAIRVLVRPDGGWFLSPPTGR